MGFGVIEVAGILNGLHWRRVNFIAADY
jgi:hypothetical protein